MIERNADFVPKGDQRVLASVFSGQNELPTVPCGFLSLLTDQFVRQATESHGIPTQFLRPVVTGPTRTPSGKDLVALIVQQYLTEHK